MTDKSSALRHRTLSGMIWSAWASGATAVLKVVVLVFLTRLLSPTDFGVVSAALIVVGFSLTFSQLGMGPALIHRPVLEPRHVSTGFFASAVVGLFFGVMIWFAAPLVARFFHAEQLTPVVRALAPLFVLAGLSTVGENLLQREMRFRLLANIDVVTYGLGYGLVAIALAFFGWGVWALVAGQLTQAVLRTALVLRMERPVLHPRPTWECFRELMGYGVGQSVGRVAVFLANQADNLVVGRWLGPRPLGLYSRAYQLMSVPTTLLGDVLDKVLFPTMARIQDDPRRLGSAYLQGSAVISLVMIPTGVVTAVLASDIVTVAFGSRWAAAVPPFQVLALGMMFRTSSRMGDSMSRATGNVYRRAWRQALYAALVFFGALAGQPYGVTGVAIGVLGALFVNYLMMAQLSLNVGQATWGQYLKAQLPAFTLALVLGAVTFAATITTRHFHLPPLAGLLISSAVALGTAVLASWLAPTFMIGEHGMRMGGTLRTYVAAQMGPRGVGGSV